MMLPPNTSAPFRQSLHITSGANYRSNQLVCGPYRCNISDCDKKFNHLPSLCRHRRIHHGFAKGNHRMQHLLWTNSSEVENEVESIADI